MSLWDRQLSSADRQDLLTRSLKRREEILQADEVWWEELRALEGTIEWLKSTLPNETRVATHMTTSSNVG